MKILHVISELSLGGGTRALVAQAGQCARLGVADQCVVSLAPAARRETLALVRGAGLLAIEAPHPATLARVIEFHDIVHLHFWNSPILYEFLRSKLPAMRLLATVHVGGEHPPQVLTRDLVAFADRIQNTSPFAHARAVFDELPSEERRRKVSMTYCPADLARLGAVSRREHAGLNALYVGTVSFVKMHPDFVDLCASITLPDIRFVVCGPGDAYPALRRRAAELGILDRFDFLGETPDIRPLLETADVFFYPLCEDNYSSGELILQEAAHAGLPAVVLAHGGAGLMVEDGVSGHVAQTPRQFREAVERLLGDPALREAMGRNARKFARLRFAEGRAGRETVRLYEDMLKLPKRRRRFSRSPGEDGPDDGARFFVRSLGEGAPWFGVSLTSSDPAEFMAADARIERTSPVLWAGGGGVADYLSRYSGDAWLNYWAGLAALGRGETGAAVASLLRAGELGLDCARVDPALARALEPLGEGGLARRAVERLLGRRLGAHEPETETPVDPPDLGSANAHDAPDFWRFTMEVLLAVGDLRRAGELFRSHPQALWNRDECNVLYRFGLECHKAGLGDMAKRAYEVVIDGAAFSLPELAAWAHFKLGELLLDQGRTRLARDHLALAVGIKPDLAKARILLVPDDEPLRVSIGPDPEVGKDSIEAPMSLFDEALWAYHFSRRRPDVVRLVAHPYFGRFEAERLAGLVGRWIAPGADVTLVLADERTLEPGLRRDLEALFGFARLRVVAGEDAFGERSAPPADGLD